MEGLPYGFALSMHLLLVTGVTVHNDGGNQALGEEDEKQEGVTQPIKKKEGKLSCPFPKGTHDGR